MAPKDHTKEDQLLENSFDNIVVIDADVECSGM